MEIDNDINLRAVPQMLEYRSIADRIVRDAPGSILDWGCGYGQISDLLLRAGLNVTSFEYRGDGSPNEVQPLDRYPNVRAYISSEPRALPYPDASFHAALSCGVLEHVVDPDASLDELHRVLRPGGTLYVFKLPNSLSYIEWIARRLGLYHHGYAPDDRLYVPAGARALVERHGYEIRELRLANMVPLTLDIPPYRRARSGPAIWAANRALQRVPGINRIATNVELVASRA